MRPHPPEVRAEAVRLYESGISHKKVARLLGVGDGTVWRWTHPDFEERQRGVSRRWKREHGAGTCRVCGRRSSYDGHTKPSADLCQQHALEEQTLPQYAVDWIVHLYYDRRLSAYAIQQRLGVPGRGSRVWSILKVRGYQLRSRGEAQRGSRKPWIAKTAAVRRASKVESWW